MPGPADLHIHTNYSDSTASPEEVVEDAKKQELSCIAITDHDVLGGIQPAMDAGEKCGIEVLPGIELSTEMNGKDIHMLGYLFDYKDEEFVKTVEIIQDFRLYRMQEMLKKLKDLDIVEINIEEIRALAQSNAVGRPHLAQVLLEKKIVSSRQEAFNKYLADGAPICVPKKKQTPFEAIELILKVGGVPVLAHPMITGVDELIPQFVEAGLKGVEVYYPSHNARVVQFYEGIAKKHQLVLTGGSDAHGSAKKHTFVGRIKIPYELIEKLKEQSAWVNQN